MNNQDFTANLTLGKSVKYTDQYDPSILDPIERRKSRDFLNQQNNRLPFVGMDVWHVYEVSWINQNGLPQVCLARLIFDASSQYLIESKSLKLYFNSLNNTVFESTEILTQTLVKDLSKASSSSVEVYLLPINNNYQFASFESWLCLDNLEVQMQIPADINTSYLSFESDKVSEKLYTNLFKSNCLVTNQPDWASVFIEYSGTKINHTQLLKYLVSYRNHSGFHEHCVERIYTDLINLASFEFLCVIAKYTRRGGIDITPYRSTSRVQPNFDRTPRQ